MAYGSKKIPVGITSGWELIKTGTFTSNFDITGLDGDNDRLWKLLIRARHTETFDTYMRFNGDSGGDYDQIHHYFGLDAGTVVHDKVTYQGQNSFLFTPLSRKNCFITTYISALSGQPRPITVLTNVYTNYNNFNLIETGGIWTWTTPKITSINIFFSPAPITAGEYWLFRKV